MGLELGLELFLFRIQAKIREQKYMAQGREKPKNEKNPSSILLIIKIECPT